MTRGRRSAGIAVAALLMAGFSACAGHGKPAQPQTVTAAYTSAAPSILTGPARRVTFAQAKRAIAHLYRRSPEIRSYVYKDVAYTPAARDKVLAVCRQGGPAGSARETGASRVFGCAPLILFFYSFGRQRSVPESIEVARKLFWYVTEIQGPYAARPPLTDLLQRWGVR